MVDALPAGAVEVLLGIVDPLARPRDRFTDGSAEKGGPRLVDQARAQRIGDDLVTGLGLYLHLAAQRHRNIAVAAAAADHVGERSTGAGPEAGGILHHPRPAALHLLSGDGEIMDDGLERELRLRGMDHLARAVRRIDELAPPP